MKIIIDEMTDGGLSKTNFKPNVRFHVDDKIFEPVASYSIYGNNIDIVIIEDCLETIDLEFIFKYSQILFLITCCENDTVVYKRFKIFNFNKFFRLPRPEDLYGFFFSFYLPYFLLAIISGIKSIFLNIIAVIISPFFFSTADSIVQTMKKPDKRFMPVSFVSEIDTNTGL